MNNQNKSFSWVIRPCIAFSSLRLQEVILGSIFRGEEVAFFLEGAVSRYARLQFVIQEDCNLVT